MTKHLTMKEVTERFSCSRQTIYSWIGKGKFPPGAKAPGGLRWKETTIERYERFMNIGHSQMRACQEALNA